MVEVNSFHGTEGRRGSPTRLIWTLTAIVFAMLSFFHAPAKAALCGDTNNDEILNVGDIVYIISYVFKGGPPPQFICDGDVNGDGELNVGDAVFFAKWIFNGGPAPICMAGGGLTGFIGCKIFDGESGPKDTPPDQDCIEYQYDGESLLILTHVNSGFNCCPGVIVVDVAVEGNTIILTETETDPLCFCLCLFDLDIEVHFLEPGYYTIQVNGLYIPPGDDPLVLDVDLTAPASGSVCITRSVYPWGE